MWGSHEKHVRRAAARGSRCQHVAVLALQRRACEHRRLVAALPVATQELSTLRFRQESFRQRSATWPCMRVALRVGSADAVGSRPCLQRQT